MRLLKIYQGKSFPLTRGNLNSKGTYTSHLKYNIGYPSYTMFNKYDEKLQLVEWNQMFDDRWNFAKFQLRIVMRSSTRETKRCVGSILTKEQDEHGAPSHNVIVPPWMAYVTSDTSHHTISIFRIYDVHSIPRRIVSVAPCHTALFHRLYESIVTLRSWIIHQLRKLRIFFIYNIFPVSINFLYAFSTILRKLFFSNFRNFGIFLLFNSN